MYTATYSPDDNKLRLYSVSRLDPETYARVRAAGFIWAPKQDLFVAPAWTPDRADLLEELAGTIDDEDRSLVDRAEERAERFTDYHHARADDAAAAHKAVERITDGIPLGQPILVGHHSERHARKDAERIENGMRRAIKMWETAEYWKRRAAGAVRHAKYKERPDVRARRIKGIEADKRKRLAEKQRAAELVRMLALVDQPEKWKAGEDGEIPTREQRAYFIAGRLSGGPYCAIVQADGPNVSTLRYSAYDVLAPDDKRYKHCPAMTVDEVIAKFAAWRAAVDSYCDRWIAHFDLRLEYERAMLAEAGGLITDRTEYPIIAGGRVLVRNEWLTVTKVNRKEGRIVSVSTNSRYVRVKGIEEVKDYQPPTVEAVKAVQAAKKLSPLLNIDSPDARHMTTEEYQRYSRSGSGGTRTVTATAERGAYRYRSAFKPGGSFTIVPVFLTDAKAHTAYPDPDEAIERPSLPAPERTAPQPIYTPREETPYDAMRETLRAGVQVISAPQLFPTPADVARTVVDLAEIQPGDRVLEPSAGTGALIDALPDGVHIVAIEINNALCRRLNTMPKVTTTIEGDFLNLAGAEPEAKFDRIVMNPPFQNGSDIRHIQHARRLLKPGGRLVAICAAGPRQRETFEPIGDWIDLPDGTFKDQGTNVRTAIVVLGAANG